MVSGIDGCLRAYFVSFGNIVQAKLPAKVLFTELAFVATASGRDISVHKTAYLI